MAEIDASAFDAPVELLKAIGHPLRFAILACLAQGERNVGEIEAATGIGQPTLSQQLSVLRNTALVQSRREAKLVFYAVDPLAIGEVCAALQRICPPDLLGSMVAKLGGSAEQAAGPVTAPQAIQRRGGAAVFARLD